MIENPENKGFQWAEWFNITLTTTQLIRHSNSKEDIEIIEEAYKIFDRVREFGKNVMGTHYYYSQLHSNICSEAHKKGGEAVFLRFCDIFDYIENWGEQTDSLRFYPETLRMQWNDAKEQELNPNPIQGNC